MVETNVTLLPTPQIPKNTAERNLQAANFSNLERTICELPTREIIKNLHLLEELITHLDPEKRYDTSSLIRSTVFTGELPSLKDEDYGRLSQSTKKDDYKEAVETICDTIANITREAALPEDAFGERTFSLSEACDALGVHKRFFRKLTQSGLPYYLMKRDEFLRLGYLRSSIIRYARENDIKLGIARKANKKSSSEEVEEASFDAKQLFGVLLDYGEGKDLQKIAKRLPASEMGFSDEDVKRTLQSALLAERVNFVDSEEFSLLTPSKILTDEGHQKTSSPHSKVKQSVLTASEERHLFRKYNYLKKRANKLQSQVSEYGISRELVRDFLQARASYLEVREQLVLANIGCIGDIAGRKKLAGFTRDAFFSEGYNQLLRAVERFDYTRNLRFSTLAYFVIYRGCARVASREYEHLKRFTSGLEDTYFNQIAVNHQIPNNIEDQAPLHVEISDCLNTLDAREREILIRRFALIPNTSPETLEEVGICIGTSKERARQLEARALQKLRDRGDKLRNHLGGAP